MHEHPPDSADVASFLRLVFEDADYAIERLIVTKSTKDNSVSKSLRYNCERQFNFIFKGLSLLVRLDYMLTRRRTSRL
jgi:hypothetical protein